MVSKSLFVILINYLDKSKTISLVLDYLEFYF
nr:MAG TPA: hypothetical protein [Bacteriophage sp.]